MTLNFIHEPELQFGNSHHIDIKFGIMNHGVLDFDQETSPRIVRLGIIGSNESIEKFSEWVNTSKTVINAKSSKKTNLFPLFPGFNSDMAFHSTISIAAAAQRTISASEISALSDEPDKNERVIRAVQLFITEIDYLSSRNFQLDVIICVPPLSLLSTIGGMHDEAEDDTEGKKGHDFRRYLKAEALRYNFPVQIALPSTYDSSVKRKVKIGSRSSGPLQDEATRAWNFFTALYYKAGGTPWRLVRNPTELQSCYIGVSFYRSLDEKTLQTSIAQVFNERGEGIIIRGAQAKQNKNDKQIHLDEPGAHSLIKTCLEKYKQEHKTLPARVVIHKSSEYNQEEINGFLSAIKNASIDVFDLLSLSSSTLRLHRDGKYPPLRGTYWELDDETKVLYTKGSVDFYQTYPGLYIPRTLKFKIASSEQSTKFLANEILSLTKMNWNNTQFDNANPITITAARQVGDILRYVNEDGVVQPSYSFYM